MTKAQKQAKEIADRRRQQLLDSGMIKPEDPHGEEELNEDGSKKKEKSMVVRNRKKKDKKKEADTTQATDSSQMMNETMDTTQVKEDVEEEVKKP